jgi:hypothetical protein
VQRFDERGVPGVVAVIAGLDRPDQQPVRHLDVAIPVDEQVDGGRGCVERVIELGVRQSCVREEHRGGLEPARLFGSDVRGFAEAACAVGGVGAEIRRAERRRGSVAAQTLRYLGAASVLAVGAIHAQQYYDDYFSVVPTIGTLFLLNFIGAGLVGAILIALVRRLPHGLGDLVLTLAALAAIGIAAGSLVSLLVSEYTPLFGFMESGYRLAIVLALLTDGLTILFLGVLLLLLALGRNRNLR